MSVLDQEEAGDVGSESRFVEVDADGVGEMEVLDSSSDAGERADSAVAEFEFVLLEVVVIENGPGPADNGIGMDVRNILEGEFIDESIADFDHRLQIIESEGVRRPEGGDDGGDLLPFFEEVATAGLEEAGPDFVVVGGGDEEDLVLADAEPTGDAQGGVMCPFGTDDPGAFAKSGFQCTGRTFLESELHAVESRPGPTEGEDASRPVWIVADEGSGHGSDFDFGESDLPRGLVADEIRIVDGREESADDAGDGGRGNNIDLGPGVSPDEEAGEMADEIAGDFFECAGFVGEAAFFGGLIIQFHLTSQQGSNGLQGIDLIQSTEKGENEVGIMHPIGDRLGEGLTQTLQDLVVGDVHVDFPEIQGES